MGSVVAIHVLEGGKATSRATRLKRFVASNDCNFPDSPFPVRITLGRLSGGSCAALLLGRRPDGSLLARDEKEAIQAVAPALRHGLSSAIQREQEEARRRQLARKVASKLRQLSRRVEALESEVAKRVTWVMSAMGGSRTLTT